MIFDNIWLFMYSIFSEARIAAAEHERHNANVEMANTANRNAAYKRELESQSKPLKQYIPIC